MAEAIAVWGDWDEATRNDPYPRFESARAQCPVQQVRLADGHDAWLVLGHEARARRAQGRPAVEGHGCRARRGSDRCRSRPSRPRVRAAHAQRRPARPHPIASSRRARFAPTRIAALEPSIAAIADELLDELEAAGPAAVDLVAGFAHPLPFRVISELLGVAQDERAALHQSFQTLFQPWSGSPPPEAVAASDAIVASLERLVATHRAQPRDDLVGVLVERERRRRPIDRTGAAVEPVPTDRRRPRHHHEPDRQRDRRPARTPRPAAPAPRRPRPDARRGRGARAVLGSGSARDLPRRDGTGRPRRRTDPRPQTGAHLPGRGRP